MDASNDTLIVPPALQAQVKAAAAEEHRNPVDLVGEAVERYLWERRWFRKDDVHAKIVQGLESLGEGKGLDGESAMAELMAELDGPGHHGAT
jgi:hypothetical protein